MTETTLPAPARRRRVSPITRRRWAVFKANRRGWWSLWIFGGLLILTLFAEFLANDRPIVVWYDGGLYLPVFNTYPETTFGGELPTAADYSDPYVRALIEAKDRKSVV